MPPKKNFKFGDIVKVFNFPPKDSLNGVEGLIVGKSFENITDVYIVMFGDDLPEPYDKWQAYVITETCLEKIGEVS